MSFKIGDIVTLKSGSAHMTVTKVNTSGFVDLTWFSPNESTFKYESSVPFDALDLVKD